MRLLIIATCLSVIICCENLNTQSVTNVSNSKVDDSIVFADTTVILDERFIAFYKKNDTLYIVNQKNDTITKIADLHPNFEFADFNGDGLKDLISHGMGNVANAQNVCIFDKVSKKFILVKGLSEFPASKLIKGTKYYYSYCRRGCNDMNWDSNLFYIDNYLPVRIGHIFGKNCKNEMNRNIRISTVKNEKEFLIAEIPISIINEYEDYKWGFIENYWTNNYFKFLEANQNENP